MDAEREVELLEELVAWSRFANREALVRTWDTVLAEQRHLVAYELSDGTRTQKEVGEQSGLSQPSISGLWQKWRRLGIAREQEGRTVHIARPSDLGVALPRLASVKGVAPVVPADNEEAQRA